MSQKTDFVPPPLLVVPKEKKAKRVRSLTGIYATPDSILRDIISKAVAKHSHEVKILPVVDRSGFGYVYFLDHRRNWIKFCKYEANWFSYIVSALKEVCSVSESDRNDVITAEGVVFKYGTRGQNEVVLKRVMFVLGHTGRHLFEDRVFVNIEL